MAHAGTEHDEGRGADAQRSIRVGPDRAESEVLGSDESTQLGRLALSGIFWRASVGTTF